MESIIRNIARRAFAAHRKHGFTVVGKELIRRALFKEKQAGAYQAKLRASEDLRWKKIRSQIPTGSRSLLDVGSNLGFFTAEAAKIGLWSVGVELSGSLVKQSQVLHENVSNCAFMMSQMDLESCKRVPSFDVMLVLSVHHHWHFTYGRDVADAMLRELVQRTQRLVIFEGPSRTSRYGEDRPSFVDNDERSVTAYYEAYLNSTVGDLVSKVLPLGSAACVGNREPYRWMYALVK